MFTKILIANRGEIACRVIQTAKQLGIKTVAVYSEADRQAKHVAMADEAVLIGPAPSAQSYLKANTIVEVAVKTGAQAIHPGYGFLSENAEFSALCAQYDVTFIGPPASAIESMGSKSRAKQIMGNADVPLIPGYHGDNQDRDFLAQQAEEIGYPVLLKAVAGGGGKGMRQVHDPKDFNDAFDAAKREAKAGFGNDDMLIEKYLLQPRHVEVQVFCDAHGNGVYLFERDCSVQRRHQKIIEEAPAPELSVELRKEMGEAAVRAAHAIDYVGAGTVEFLLDERGLFYFMEMNTRLQVEHPVTEKITGQDLVEWQLRVASGEVLPLAQEQLTMNGHAFEARIYAEDADADFMPSTGVLDWLQEPAQSQHVRVDSGVRQGDEVTMYYDPMIAKLIVWGETREIALQRLVDSLRQYQVIWPKTNIPFLLSLARHHEFANANLSTSFIEQHHEQLFENTSFRDEDVALASMALLLNRQKVAAKRGKNSPWHLHDGWQMNAKSEYQMLLSFGDRDYDIRLVPTAEKTDIYFNELVFTALGSISETGFSVELNGRLHQVQLVETANTFALFGGYLPLMFSIQTRDHASLDGEGDAHYKAPMNGTVSDVMVAVGDQVTKGQTLIVVEAMKMEHPIKATADAVVEQVYCGKGDQVTGGQTVIELSAE